MPTPRDLLERARRRCAEHLPGRGLCQSCLLEELEEGLVHELGLERGEAHELLEELMEWAEEPEH